MTRLVVATAIAVALAAAATAAHPAAAPRTLAYADAPIVAFAHDGRYVAWVSSKNCLGTVRVRDIQARRQKAVGAATDGQCDNLDRTFLTLGGDRALWTSHETGNEVYDYVHTGGLTAKARTVGANIADMPPYPVGDHLAAIAGGGGALVWSKAYVSVHGSDDCDIQNTCVTFVQKGFVYRAKSRSVKIPGAGASVLLATDGKTLALGPAGVSGPNLRPKPGAKVEVRRLTTGALVSAFAPTGTPEALAVFGQNVAVLTKSTVEFRSLAGALLWKRAAPAAASALSLSPLGVVYRVGRTIRRFSPKGLPSQVVVARATPIGLRASGKRIAWAENVKLQGKLTGRIQAVEVP